MENSLTLENLFISNRFDACVAVLNSGVVYDGKTITKISFRVNADVVYEILSLAGLICADDATIGRILHTLVKFDISLPTELENSLVKYYDAYLRSVSYDKLPELIKKVILTNMCVPEGEFIGMTNSKFVLTIVRDEYYLEAKNILKNSLLV